MDRCCENCWRVDTCSTEDKERAADSWDFSCFEAPDKEEKRPF